MSMPMEADSKLKQKARVEEREDEQVNRLQVQESMSDLATDREWMRSYLRDEKEGFDQIYARYSGAIYGYLGKRVQDSAERDDLYQRVWMKFHRSRVRWSDQYPLLQWLFVISRSVLLDHFRKEKRSPAISEFRRSEGKERQSLLDQIPDERPEPGIESERLAEREELDRILLEQGLSEDQVRVIEMHAIDEEDYESIARQTGKTSVTARKIFSRGIAKLKSSPWARSKRASSMKSEKESE
jgi:RNA polymerase sigma-70 factor (ECF subfamily)